jgi:colanic acid biosynthesis glycosyl transferase WcaI
VLAVADPKSDAARIVCESGCGLAVDPDDPAAVAEAIRALRNDPPRLAEMGRRARETAKKYARVNELQKFAGIIEEAVQEKMGGRHLES